jgi:hypothetical protein
MTHKKNPHNDLVNCHCERQRSNLVFCGTSRPTTGRRMLKNPANDGIAAELDALQILLVCQKNLKTYGTKLPSKT